MSQRSTLCCCTLNFGTGFSLLHFSGVAACTGAHWCKSHRQHTFCHQCARGNCAATSWDWDTSHPPDRRRQAHARAAAAGSSKAVRGLAHDPSGCYFFIASGIARSVLMCCVIVLRPALIAVGAACAPRPLGPWPCTTPIDST